MVKDKVVVYYSWTGNTRIVAEEIGHQLDADVLEIKEKKVRKRGNIPKAALSAILGIRSQIENNIDIRGYEEIFIGAQVWAGHITPPINRYLENVDLRNKKVWLFVTRADDKPPEKVIEKLTKKVHRRGGTLEGVFSIQTPALINNDICITHSEVRDNVTKWLNDIGQGGKEI